MLLSKVSLPSCQNPFCLNFNKKPFATQPAYTQHIDRIIGCHNFIVRKSHVAAPHGASVSCRCSLHEDGLVKGPVTRSLLVEGIMLLMMSLLQETWQLVMVLKL
jgi:hypothetical protein